MREESGIAAGLVSLPSGGGGIAPVGDRFEPDLLRGSGSYQVPIHCPKGPNELQPSLSLTYSTGSGNGPFGLGWRLNILRIERRTDRGLPNYTEDDTFVIGDAEVLAPAGNNRYRPKTETKFWLIERTGDSWQIRMGDGRTMFFGQTPQTRESGGARVFAWYLSEERDAAGNSITYSYRRDGNRLYLEEIRYSIFRVRFIYEPRPDLLRNGRAGFQRLMALRARSVEVHCDRLAPTLMRTYTIQYAQAVNGASLLARITLSAQEGAVTASFPELSFEYAPLDFSQWQVHELQALITPPSLDDSATQLVDMTGDGLPDVLQSQGSRMMLWRNRGDGWLDGPAPLEGVPSTVSLSAPNVAFADLEGNGRVDLFAVDQPVHLAFEADGRGGFRPDPVVFRDRPSVRLAATDTRLMDVDGDGITDIISTGRSDFLLFRHRRGAGFQEPEAVPRVPDLERFPDLTFGDRGVRVADMTGDGLQDFLAAESGHFVYWPYLGNGVWGERVEMQNSPRFPENYREDRVHIVDLDGDGCSDVVYMDYDRTLIWINQSGAAFSDPFEVPVSPGFRNARIMAADLFGDGRPGFAWTSTANREDSARYRFLRFDQGRAPYLMTAVNNGLGGISQMHYSTSTAMRLRDQAEGRAWPGQLPFVLRVVENIVETDAVTGRTVRRSFRYHDGVYDGPSREFRGFSQVDSDMDGDDSVPASRQEFDFFQGDPEHIDAAERDRQRALCGSVTASRVYERANDGYVLLSESAQTWDTRLENPGDPNPVFFPFLTAIETREHSHTGSPQRIERSFLSDYDEHGNVGRRRRESLAEGAPPEQWIRSEETFRYTNNTVDWLVKLPVRYELRDSAGVPFAIKMQYYDGPAFTGLPEGQVQSGLLTRVQELRLLESRLPADYIGDRDLSNLGYELLGAGDTRGYYATTVAFRRDPRGNVVERRDPLGNPITISYDADGVYPIRSADPRGSETSFQFDPKAGEPSNIAFPDGRSVRYVHDAIGRLQASFETDDAGVEQLVKCWVLDLSSTPVSLTSVAPYAGGRTLDEFLAPAAGLAALEGASVSRAYYDGYGNQVLQVSTGPDDTFGARRFITARRALPNVRSQPAAEFLAEFRPDLSYFPFPAPGPGAIRYRYDAQGSRNETAGPGPVHHRVVRDTFSIQHYEGAGAADPPGAPVRVERFDARGRLFRIEEAKGDGSFISTTYDLAPDGYIQVVRDHAGREVARYAFGSAGQVIRITHRDVGARTYYRNAAGLIAERIGTDGSRLFYSYDALQRLIRIEHSAPGSATRDLIREIIYDTDPSQASEGRFLDGRIAVVREAAYEIHYSYNRAGKKIREEVTTGGTTLATAHEYDFQGNLQAIVYPDGFRLAYTLDRAARPSAIPGIASEIAYDADGAVTGYLLANGVRISAPRDPVSRRFAETSAERLGATLRRVSYTYDSVGDITALRDETPTAVEFQSFAYDGLYRLTGFEVRQNDAAGPVLRAGTYSYSTSGDLLTLQETQALTLDYSDPVRPGRLTSVTAGAVGQPVSYEARGHITAFGDLAALEFDPLDRLARAVKGDGTELRFSYDPENRRLVKEVMRGGGTTRTHYATGLYEQSDSGAIRHIYLANALVASQSLPPGAGAPTTAFYLSDHHGTLLLATDAAGAIIQNQRYSPFGLPLDAAGSLDRYLGRVRDSETGLLHLGARYYAPALGRFISPDWFALENPSRPARLPQAFNLYAYAINNPLVFRDPSGLFFFLLAIVAAAVFTVGFVSGLIYGLTKGQGWNSFLTGLETGLTTLFGTALGALTGFVVGGPAGAIIGGLMGGMNGLISGVHGIYDWEHPGGWLAFLSDSTWGLLGTSLGNMVHIANFIAGGANYREDLSHRQNRHVYEGGVYLAKDDAFTQGNVISNASAGGKPIDMDLINKHESLHILQNRIFGPIFQAGYLVWTVGAFIVGSVFWLFHTDHSYGDIIETAVYYDNPFEYWAYSNQGYWQPVGQKGFDPIIAWG